MQFISPSNKSKFGAAVQSRSKPSRNPFMGSQYDIYVGYINTEYKNELLIGDLFIGNDYLLLNKYS